MPRTLNFRSFELDDVSRHIARQLDELPPDLHVRAAATAGILGPGRVVLLLTADRLLVLDGNQVREFDITDIESVQPAGITTRSGSGVVWQSYASSPPPSFLNAVADGAGADRVGEGSVREARRVPLLTLPAVPGSDIVEALGLVTAVCVMSRNFMSDIGSDISSAFGGQLGGIQTAIEAALNEARNQLWATADSLAADAVVGLHVSLETVADKAQAVMLVGTAVRVRASAPPHPEAAATPLVVTGPDTSTPTGFRRAAGNPAG